jgi:putative flippase GtrA
MRVGLLAIVCGVVWTIVLVLTWTWRAEGRDSGKEMVFRYVLTVLLLLMVQIGGLSVTVFLHWSRQSIEHHKHEREMMRPNRVIEPSH